MSNEDESAARGDGARAPGEGATPETKPPPQQYESLPWWLPRHHRVRQVFGGVALVSFLGGGGKAAIEVYRAVFPAQTDGPKPAPALIDGVRVESRETVLDLSDWSVENADRAVSSNRFVVVRHKKEQNAFVHRYSTTASEDPKAWSDSHEFEVVPVADHQTPGGLREWQLEIDIAEEPLHESFELSFFVVFLGSFSRPEQQWGGFRVLHPTSDSIYRVRFPRDRPADEIVKFTRIPPFTNAQEEELDPGEQVSLVHTADGRVSEITWHDPEPLPDYSYRIYWRWAE